MVTIILTDAQLDSITRQQTGGIEIPPVQPPVDPGTPPATGGALDGFDWMLAHAPEFVAWRWVLQAAPPAVHQALMDRHGANAYNWKKNDVSYNQPPASYYNGRMYWRDPTWTGPEPVNILAPGNLSIAVAP